MAIRISASTKQKQKHTIVRINREKNDKNGEETQKEKKAEGV